MDVVEYGCVDLAATIVNACDGVCSGHHKDVEKGSLTVLWVSVAAVARLNIIPQPLGKQACSVSFTRRLAVHYPLVFGTLVSQIEHGLAHSLVSPL